jgi:hypothetical protein
MNVGVQPLDALMTRLGLTNHDVVALAAGSGLTHKQVAKARRGRRVTINIQNKILRALNSVPGLQAPFRREDCFTYTGRPGAMVKQKIKHAGNEEREYV